MSDYYKLTATATSRSGVAGNITVYSSERDTEINSSYHDAYLMRDACKMKRAKQTGVGEKALVERGEYLSRRGFAYWKASPLHAPKEMK